MIKSIYRALLTVALVVAILWLIIAPPRLAFAQTQLTTSPTIQSGLSAGAWETILQDTELTGLGQALESGEKLYGVNAIFVAAILAHESGWGTSRLAQEENNLGGIKGGSGYRSFDTPQICVLYMFNLLDRLYISTGRTTIAAIGQRYCDPPDHWVQSIESIMDGLIVSAGAVRE